MEVVCRDSLFLLRLQRIRLRVLQELVEWSDRLRIADFRILLHLVLWAGLLKFKLSLETIRGHEVLDLAILDGTVNLGSVMVSVQTTSQTFKGYLV